MNSILKSGRIKRHIVYVDENVQKGFLLALVTLEVLLIAGTLWMLYLQMGEILDRNLYRVHFSESPNIYPLMIKAVIIGMSGLIIINILALWGASWFWARHVNSILNPFRELIGKVEELDFREDITGDAPHKVVELAQSWRRSKRQDMLRLRKEISALDQVGDLTDPETRARARAALESIRAQLPNW